jgi:hypothetical protein
MPFDRQAEYQAQLQHLISLARLPDWKLYAWNRAKELDADKSGLFHGIAQDLTAAMSATGLAGSPVSGNPHPTRRP